MTELVPYNQHFIHVAEIIGKPDDQVVFQYLWDLYCCRVRMNQPTLICFSYRDIAAQRRMNYRTIKSSIQHLEAIGLISVDHNLCTVNARKYIALATAFYNIKDKEAIDKFSAAVETEDRETLKSFGVNEDIDDKEIILEMKGSIVKMQSDCKNATELQKYNSIAEMQSDCKNTIELQKCNGIVKIQFDCKNAIFDAEMQYELQKCNTFLNQIILEVTHLIDVVKMQSDCKNAIQVLQKYNQALQKCNTENNIYNNKENNNVTFLSSKEEIKDNQKKEDNLENSRFRNFLEVELPAENSFEEEDSQESFENHQVDPDGYRKYKKLSALPFYSRDNVEMFITSPDLTVDNPRKLFIHLLWSQLEYYFTSDETDEEGNAIENRHDPEGRMIDFQDLRRFVLEPAMDALRESVEKGYVECEKGRFPLTFQDIPEELDFFDIIGWPYDRSDNNVYYTISKSQFRNLEGEPLESVQPERARRGSGNHKRNEAYFRQLVSMGRRGGEDLTDMEVAVYCFLSDYFIIAEDGTVGEPDYERLGKRFVSKIELFDFIRMIQSDYGISREDFLEVVNREKVNPSGCLNLRGAMFSVEKIEAWNNAHGQESQVLKRIEEVKIEN